MSRQRQDRRPWVRRVGRAGAVAISVGAHAALAVALLLQWRTPPALTEAPPIAVALIELPPPAPPPPPPTPVSEEIAPTTPPPAQAPSAPRAPVPVRSRARPSPAPPQLESPPAAASRSNAQGVGLSDSQLAGASSADSGNGTGAEGQGCHMAQRVQAALRRDSLVQASVAHATDSGPRAIMVWNGDWVQSDSEDGKGLAAVREAIVWEVAFAPQACRAERMRGLILLSLNGAPGSPRLAVGAGDWRWSDLLNR